MEDEQVSILVESRNGDDSAAGRTAAVIVSESESSRDVAGAGESRAKCDDACNERTHGSSFADDAMNNSRRSPQRDNGKLSDCTSADDQMERNGLLRGAANPMTTLCGPSGRVAQAACDDDDEDERSLRKRQVFAKYFGGESAVAADVEAQIRIRRVDFDAKNENHYVIVIHGTFDAPPADGAPTWYQPPPPGEQNFCRKLSRLLALGPIGQDAIWRELPCSALPGIPYPFHWDGSNTHAGRVTAAAKLHNLIDQIAQNDPAARIHLVAHSHGGNVLLKTIELYMAKLSRRKKNEWNPAVAKQFWAAHKRSYELIKKWRRIDLGGSWWRFFPFLVVYRGFNGRKAAGVKERYPWAYHQWLDSLLGLPAVRQQRFLAFRHATSPITNALGALVFLGTPFYIKKWQSHGFIWMLVSTVINVVLMYTFILVYTSMWQIIVLLIAGRPQEFYTNSAPNFLIAAAVMLPILIKQVMDAAGNTVFYSGNLYHNPAFDWSPAMSALVIHAGKLDEASLALSMEPIARAYVFPHLTKLLKQTPWAPFPKAPTRYARHRDWWAYGFNCLIVLVWDTLFFLPAALMSVFSYIIAPIVTSTLQKMIVTVSFGLSPGDLNNAYIYVDEHLDMDLTTQQVDHWNVQKLLAEAKTKSLKGELMPGYEDDTVEQPEWMGPAPNTPHTPHTPRTPRTPHALDLDAPASANNGGSKSGPATVTGATAMGVAAAAARGAATAGAAATKGAAAAARGAAAATRGAAAATAVAVTHATSSLRRRFRDLLARRGEGDGDLTNVQSLRSARSERLAILADAAVAAFEEAARAEAEAAEAKAKASNGGTGVVEDEAPVKDTIVEVSEEENGFKGGGEGERVRTDEGGIVGGTSVEGPAAEAAPGAAVPTGPAASGSPASGSVASGIDATGNEATSSDATSEAATMSPIHKFKCACIPGGEIRELSADAPSSSVSFTTTSSPTAVPATTAEPAAAAAPPGAPADAAGDASASASVYPPAAISTAAAPLQEAPEGNGQADKLVYDFLWNDKELSILAEQSQTYQRLKSQMHKIGRNPRLSEEEFDRNLKQLCVMIKERAGELTGRCDLNHGAYFRDPRILRVIAHFLEKRELPEWSKDVDGDIWRWNDHLASVHSMQLLQMSLGSKRGGAGAGWAAGRVGGGTGGGGKGEEVHVGEGSSHSSGLKSLMKRMGSVRENLASRSMRERPAA